MKPLPAQQASEGRKQSESIPSLPGPLASSTASFSSANRRSNICTAQRAYPWLLSASTATAALFCLMYITKPVIVPAPDSTQLPAPAQKPVLSMNGGASSPASLMPSDDRLPGEPSASGQSSKPISSDPRSALPGPPSDTAFEETNLRVQHILTAEAPGGHKDRIDIDVPVLYQSRSLRWTTDEVAVARDLLVRLMDYQEKTRQLRSEGVELLDSWNHLVGESIPTAQLRADSPSLPENQEDAADAPRPADLITTEAIQIQSSGK
jgi:hypothetical protein